MAPFKERILFLPGIFSKERGEEVKIFANGFHDYCTEKDLEISRTTLEEDDLSIIRFKVKNHHGQEKFYDFTEIYWGDLMSNLNDLSPVAKLFQGMSLCIYWITRKGLWKKGYKNKWVNLQLITATLTILGWYLTTLLGILSTVDWTSIQLPYGTPDSLEALALEFQNRIAALWILLTALIQFFPLTLVADAFHKMRCYFQNRNSCSRKVRARTLAAIYKARNIGNYDKITIAAHCFGSIPAIEAMAHLEGETKNIRLLSLGSLVWLMRGWSDNVQDTLKTIKDRYTPSQWLYYYSTKDWLCSSHTPQEFSEAITCCEIKNTTSLLEKMNFVSHQLYFTDWDVMDEILG